MTGDSTYWRERAACLRADDPDMFFPVGNDGPSLVEVDEAKAVCSWCPVLEQCLDLALQLGPVQGVWGGTTESERRAIRRRDARPTTKKAVTLQNSDGTRRSARV
ncbi:WhiB family transcriptional regulator [Streptomyces antibioticus]